MSNLVCQVPDCRTTQAVIEEELETYLSGFCAQCDKPREGRLCGCAFPCSLTFKGQMLLRIHELLGLDPPVGMKSIQVCYKHPDLLKQARETCIAIRDSQEEAGIVTKVKEGKGKGKQVKKTSSSSNQDSLHLSLVEPVTEDTGEDTLLGSLEEKLGKITEVVEERGEPGEEVTSIVYTDEGGREQSLVGKIVYQTDESGHSNIIIQEMEPRRMLIQSKNKKLMKLDLGDMEGYMMSGVQGDGEEALEQRLEEELEGSEARLEEELEFEAARDSNKESVRLKFQLESSGEPATHTEQVKIDKEVVPLQSDNTIQYNSDSTVQYSTDNSVQYINEGEVQYSSPDTTLQYTGGDGLQYSTDTSSVGGGVGSTSHYTARNRCHTVSLATQYTKDRRPVVVPALQGVIQTTGVSSHIAGVAQVTQLTGNFNQLGGSVIHLQGLTSIGQPGSVILTSNSQGQQRNLAFMEASLATEDVRVATASQPKKLVPIFPKPPENEASKKDEGVEDVEETDDNMLKIQYKEYEQKILSVELKPLLSQTELCDTLLVCRDGKVLTSGLVLASLSSFLRTLLDSVPRIDQFKTVLLPEEVSITQVILLNKIIFEEFTSSVPTPLGLSLEQQEQVSQLAFLLGCTRLLELTARSRTEDDVRLGEADRGTKRPAPSCQANNNRRRPVKAPKVSLASAAPPSSVKLEKTDLNADYMDEAGLVRLSSVDEMAMHYCLLCDGKFKKYNQAITHYDLVHSMMAALACDQCDETFRDMYSCVKHKHEFHGQFDGNFQCYICKEVLYSRFRLGTHIKECHKQFFGEFVCRACGMKFSAQYYLTKHQKESHADSANTCNICQKTFSGRRYLTMHIKANHESGTTTGDSLSCKECDKVFPTARDKAYHASKVHGSPRPEGVFEDCMECDKWFKTKGELAQHEAKMHKGKTSEWQQQRGHENTPELVKAEAS